MTNEQTKPAPQTVEARPLHEQRRAGVCLHFTSLPGPHGIGEIGRDAHRFIDQMCNAGLSVWQFLPTGPTAFGDSPYQPLSAHAGNPMLIELRELIELDLLEASELAALESLPRDHVDYGALIPAKTRLLEKAAARFATRPRGALSKQFDAFCDSADNHWLDDYALFAAMKTANDGVAWPQWPTPCRRRDAETLALFARKHHAAIVAIKFAQFLFYRQWQALHAYARARGVMLFGDMPIYIALDCADAWAHSELLRIDSDGTPDAVAGVPPDYFSSDGQLWGNPLYDWDFHAHSDYAWWVERLRQTLRHVDLVRIDHFRGFEAYWSIPFGDTTARGGHWEPGPKDAIFDAMRAALGRLPIVAEDLGDITPAVHELRLRQQMPGMSVLQFMIGNDDFDADNIATDQACYTGTHDNDTTIGWFRGDTHSDVRSDDDVLRSQTNTLRHAGGTASEVNWALIRVAFDCKACLAIAPMQDFLGLGSAARMNTPGEPADNWQWRLRAGAFSPRIQAKILALATGSARTP